MTAPASDPGANTVEDALSHPTGQVNGMQTDLSTHQRLSMQMRLATEDDPTQVADPGPWSKTTAGVPNPYGKGLSAFEPNNVLFQGYAAADKEVQDSKAADQLKAQEAGGKINIAGGGQAGSVLGNATGKVGAFVQAALNAASRRVPYVWGGTSLSNGTDCSGLIYAAANAAGIPLQRYVAHDYLNMGQQVDAQTAKPGDLVVYPEDMSDPSSGHVGIYLGNGQMVDAPQSGDVVKIQAVWGQPVYRRLFTDDAMQQVATPGGGRPSFSYNGQAYQPWLGTSFGSTLPSAAVGSGSRNSGMRAI